jgi:hypothetical protein
MKLTSAPAEEQQKQPRHVAIAQRHLLAQRDKATSVRNKSAKEVEELDAALLALGWAEQLKLTE